MKRLEPSVSVNPDESDPARKACSRFGSQALPRESPLCWAFYSLWNRFLFSRICLETRHRFRDPANSSISVNRCSSQRAGNCHLGDAHLDAVGSYPICTTNGNTPLSNRTLPKHFPTVRRFDYARCSFVDRRIHVCDF